MARNFAARVEDSLEHRRCRLALAGSIVELTKSRELREISPDVPEASNLTLKPL